MQFKSVVLAISCLALASVWAGAQEPKPMTNQDVIAMVKAGLPESTVLASVKNAPQSFSTTPQDLIGLQQAGVPTAVMEAMIARNSAASETSSGAVPVGIPPGMPTSFGVVAMDGDNRIELTQLMCPTKSKGAGFMGLSKMQQIALCPGGKSNDRLSTRSPRFEVPLPQGMDPSQMIRLVRMQVQGETRTTPIQLIGYDTMVYRNKVPEVGDEVIEATIEQQASSQPGAPFRMYSVVPKAPLEPGEYAVVTHITTIWDFGVD